MLRFFPVLLCILLLQLVSSSNAQNLIRNPSLEGGSGSDGAGGGVPEWLPFGHGYDISRTIAKTGQQSITCNSISDNLVFGASQDITVNQTTPEPIVVTAWSKAADVQDGLPSDYSLYADITYTDHSHLWAQTAPFASGTHDWERAKLTILPKKPIQSFDIYLLFRNHRGTVWFDDVHAVQLDGDHLFDSQILTLPALHRIGGEIYSLDGQDGISLKIAKDGRINSLYLRGKNLSGDYAGGFYVRDVAQNSPVYFVKCTVSPREAGGYNLGGVCGPLHLILNVAIYRSQNSIGIDGEIDDTTHSDRAVSVYFTLPVDAIGWTWGDNIQHYSQIQAPQEYANLTHVGVGATGTISLYPFAEIADSSGGVGFQESMQWPSVSREFYSTLSRQFVFACDMALTTKTRAWVGSSGRFRCRLFSIPAGRTSMAFRQAAARFYSLNRGAYPETTTRGGIWMPFTSPETIANAADFHIAYHEGDNSVEADHKNGIQCFHYIEPSTYWMPMAPALPRTNNEAMSLIQQHADGNNGEAKEWAQAVLNSADKNADGTFITHFSDTPWNNGVMFVIDPTPALRPPDQPTKASLSYSFNIADKRYQQSAVHPDGEYLDSLESWCRTQDYRKNDLASCTYPIPFDSSSLQPVLPQWYSVFAFTQFVSEDLHNRGLKLMANWTPKRFTTLMSLLDIAGTETNWLNSNGKYTPQSDTEFDLQRTLSFRKPYLLLMDTDFSKFTHADVRRYFLHCLFYDVFPSMFSQDAADHPYWEDPKLYNRDRDLFKQYIPLMQKLSKAGWEPVTHAQTHNDSVYIERYGQRYFTLRNSSSLPQETDVKVNLQKLGIASAAAVTDLVTGNKYKVQLLKRGCTIVIKLVPHQTMLLEIN